MMYTAGSNAVTSYYRPLRTLGAQVRRVLLDNAARKLGVPVEELTTEPSLVVHAKSGRKLSYGEIAAFAEVPVKAPDIKPEQLKKPADFRLIGKDVMRVELPSKVNGTAKYGIDIQVPGMPRADVIVLGAGIVGTSAAFHLAKRGLSVVLLDKRGPGEETSYGNAGVIEGNTLFPHAFPSGARALLRIALKQAPEANYHVDDRERFRPRIASTGARSRQVSGPVRS